jgi:hypothetical protein
MEINKRHKAWYKEPLLPRQKPLCRRCHEEIQPNHCTMGGEYGQYKNHLVLFHFCQSELYIDKNQKPCRGWMASSMGFDPTKTCPFYLEIEALKREKDKC